MPTSAPTKPSSKRKFQIKQTPAPAPSKLTPSTSVSVGGNPKMFPSSSVITQVLLVPLASVSSTLIPLTISGLPSTINSKGPPESTPAFVLLRVTCNEFDKSNVP